MENLQQTKQLLENKRDQLLGQLKDLEERDPSEDAFRTYSNTPDDESVEVEAGQNVTAERAMVNKTLTQVNRALEKIDAGTYGVCDMTGDQIDPERLNAIPWATYTLESEKELEEKEG